MPLGRSRPAHVVSHHLGSYSALRLRVYCAPHPDIGLALVSDPSTHRLARKLEPCQGFIPCANTPRRSPLAGSRTASPRPSSLLPLNRHCIAEHRNAQHKCGLVFTSLERTADRLGKPNLPQSPTWYRPTIRAKAFLVPLGALAAWFPTPPAHPRASKTSRGLKAHNTTEVALPHTSQRVRRTCTDSPRHWPKPAPSDTIGIPLRQAVAFSRPILDFRALLH